MADAAAEDFLRDAIRQLRKYKGLADGAVAQVSEADLFRSVGPEANSIAIVMKHLSGNMRARWTDFLTTDAEKADRRRDAEFEREAGDTPAGIKARWEEAWRLTFDAVARLSAEDLVRTVPI